MRLKRLGLTFLSTSMVMTIPFERANAAVKSGQARRPQQTSRFSFRVTERGSCIARRGLSKLEGLSLSSKTTKIIAVLADNEDAESILRYVEKMYLQQPSAEF